MSEADRERYTTSPSTRGIKPLKNPQKPSSLYISWSDWIRVL